MINYTMHFAKEPPEKTVQNKWAIIFAATLLGTIQKDVALTVLQKAKDGYWGF